MSRRRRQTSRARRSPHGIAAIIVIVVLIFAFVMRRVGVSDIVANGDGSATSTRADWPR